MRLLHRILRLRPDPQRRQVLRWAAAGVGLLRQDGRRQLGGPTDPRLRRRNRHFPGCLHLRPEEPVPVPG